MAIEKPAGEKILDALKKAGLKVGRPIKVKQTKESKRRWKVINKFQREIQQAHEDTKNSKLRFGTKEPQPQ